MSSLEINHSLGTNQKYLSQTPVATFLDGSDQFVLDCLTSLKQMDVIETEWKHLEHICSEPFIYFQSFDWCYNWSKTYAENEELSQLRIFTLRKNSDLVMIWPMMVSKVAPGISSLTFLTEPHGQYGNVICDSAAVPISAGKICWKHIRDNARVDAITLDQYPKISMLEEILGQAGVIENSDRHASILELSQYGSMDEYRATLDRKLRKQRNQRRNKLARQGELTYDVHYGGTEEYHKLVDLALEWKQVWLRETGRRATVLSQDSTKQFLSGLPGTGHNQYGVPNGVNLGVLGVGGKPIGIEIGMCLDGHYYSYLGAFDWEWRKFSPGKTQIEEAQNWALEIGLDKFDFLGDPADYKGAWTNSSDAMQSRSVPLSFRGYVYCVIWKANLRPLARKIFNQLDSTKRAKLLQLLGIQKNTYKNVAPKTIAQATIQQRQPNLKI